MCGKKKKKTYSQYLCSSARTLEPDWNLQMIICEGHLLMGVMQKSSLAGRLSWKQISRTMRVIKHTKEETSLIELFQAFISHSLLQPKFPIFIISSPATMFFYTFYICFLSYCKLLVSLFHSPILHIICGQIIFSTICFIHVTPLSKMVILLKYSCFTMLCQSLLYSKVTQVYTYIHSFFYIIFYYGLSQEIEYSSLCFFKSPFYNPQWDNESKQWTSMNTKIIR